ncbi:MAG: helix-turn-helix transcriptional regulator [Flavobacteriales bacterium]|nr:helix-turn-helix transcriptional regulator [Flavobacteriales bacterium]MCB9178042.1 helix-turn-helix transcriptional regulator [Flavobacteriales bacterium]
MITLNLPRIAAIMGIQRPYSFLVKNGFTPQTAKDLLAGRTKRLDLAHLERLCRLFACEPYDLLDYEPAPNTTFTGVDKLAFLAKPKAVEGIHALLQGLSLKEMEALVADVAKRREAA